MGVPRRIVWVLAAALVLALLEWAAAQTVIRHSGTVAGIDRSAGTIVLAEIGPWRVKGGVTEVTRRTIDITPRTQFVKVKRSLEATSGFPGEFVESRLEPWNVAKGDFVTVECQHRGERHIGEKVAVTEIAAP